MLVTSREELRNVILDSVYVPGRVDKLKQVVTLLNGSTVHSDTYVRNTIRELRNTYHGYYTKWFDEYLVISTGNTPDNDNNEVYYIFECMAEGKKASISTSAWTLLNSLKTHMPLAGKTLVITQKNVNGKKMYYVTTPDAFGAPTVEKTNAETNSEGETVEDLQGQTVN